MRTNLSIAVTVLALWSGNVALAQNGDLGIFGAARPAQADGDTPRAQSQPRPAPQTPPSDSNAILGQNDVFVVAGVRTNEQLATLLAREYHRDFRSAAVAGLRDGRWAALIGWTGRAGVDALLQDLRRAGRIPDTAFTIAGSQVGSIVWSAAGQATRENLRIPANVRRTPILQGMGIMGAWAATPAACAAGFNRDDLLEGTMQIGSRQFVWGSFGRCNIGSTIRVAGGLFVGAVCGRGDEQEKFVLSLRRRGPRLEVITDPAKPNKLYYQFDWCPKPGSGARVARAPDSSRRVAPANRGDEPARKARSTGSGFFVTAAGHLVTNEHVVRKCGEVFVKGFGRAQVVKEDANNDLALLKLKAPKPVPFLKIRTMPIQLGQEVVVFGYPLSSILNNGLNVTTGIVSSETGIRNDQRLLQFTAAIQPGNSGGPVVDRSGDLVAVVRSKFSDKFALDRGNFVPQNLNYGIRTNILTRFLSDNGVSAQSAAVSAERSVADLAAAARAHTMLVTCH